MKKRFFALLLAIVAVIAITGCSKKVTVTFDTDGGSAVASVEVKKGSAVSKPTDPTKANFTFDGWYLGDTKYDFSKGVEKDITLKAHWKGEQVTVTFNSMGGSSVPSARVTKGEKVAKPTDPTRRGFTFRNWYLDGKTYNFNNPVNENITLEAQWTKDSNFTFVNVTFKFNNGIQNDLVIEVVQGDPVERVTDIQDKEGGFRFQGWFLNGEVYEFDTPVTRDITLEAHWISSTYQPRWTPNDQTGGWQGQGMDYKILVLPTSSFDPFDTNYTASDKSIKQKQQQAVNSAYKINIRYEAWPDDAAWGPTRVDYIKKNANSGDFKNNDVFAINIASSWIPTLAKENILAPLAKIDNQGNVTSGLFQEIGYQETQPGSGIYTQAGYAQDKTNNQITSCSGTVYGYASGSVHPDYFMYYNADIIKKAGMEDPAVLWLRGEWTWTRFESYVNELQTILDSQGNSVKALALGYAEFIIGSVAAQGSFLANSSGRVNITSQAVRDQITKIRTLHTTKLYDTNRGQADVPASFTDAKSVFTHGDLWFLKDPSRFDNVSKGKLDNVIIGAVPYPTADGQSGTPIYTDDVSEAILDYNNQPITNRDNPSQYIKGLDLSKSNFQVPYTSTSCYSILTKSQGKNNITEKISFAIIYDLNDGLGDDPDQVAVSKETAYRNFLNTKLDRTLYADTLMTVEGRTYFEVMDLLSMTAGNGSHFGPDGFWPKAANLITSSDSNIASTLQSIADNYQKVLRENLGYTG